MPKYASITIIVDDGETVTTVEVPKSRDLVWDTTYEPEDYYIATKYDRIRLSSISKISFAFQPQKPEDSDNYMTLVTKEKD